MSPVTEIEIVNRESTGYIQVVVDGIDERFDRDVLERDSKGKVHKHHVKRSWQAGPGQEIVIRRSNWSPSIRSASVVVKYFGDDGRLNVVSEPRQYQIDPAPGVHRFEWDFHRADVGNP
jgi:hypothetical protein